MSFPFKNNNYTHDCKISPLELGLSSKPSLSTNTSLQDDAQVAESTISAIESE
jgi:hypothetical protein